jgi:acyl carrier protein
METEEIKNVLIEELKKIAPEIDQDDLEMDEDIRDQVDLDSMDYLKFITVIGKRFDKQIPEKDYAQLETLDGFISYLSN